jgi:hypothetical protein
VHKQQAGRRRVHCYTRSQGGDCTQPSAYLDVYEAQIAEHLAGFVIPADYQERILAQHRKLIASVDDTTAQRRKLERQLDNRRELFKLADISRAEYLAEREELQAALRALAPADDRAAQLAELAALLANAAQAWAVASQAERNRIAQLIFEQVWVQKDEVVAVKPRPELQPFFALDCHTRGGTGGSDGIRTRGLCLDRAAC